MKTRNGFVSNSSSSSFVVAFPKKPKSFNSVFKMMFNEEDGIICPFDHVDGISKIEVAKRVWDDIKQKLRDNRNNKVNSSLNDIVEEFSNRYWYRTESFSGWDYNSGPYFGNNINLLNQLKDSIIAVEKEEKEIYEKQRKISELRFGKERVTCAYSGGINSKTKKPYTKKQIQAYETYMNEWERFKKEDEEYCALEKRLREMWHAAHKKHNELRYKLAMSDAKAFIKDHEKSSIFILSYSDNSPGETNLEHGNIFENIPHVTISHH